MFFRFVVVLALCVEGLNGATCSNPESSCKCETDEGTVDLSSLDSGSSSSPGLTTESTISDYTYDYNPCTPFTESSDGSGGTGCTNIMGCQVNKNMSPINYWPLADASTYSWGSDGTNLLITMTKNDGQTDRTMVITLICDENTDADFQVTDDSTLTYTFSLTSKCACPGGCKGGGGGTTVKVSISISFGSILLIVALAVVLIYFIGGILFMHYAKGAKGSEKIPNVTFWKAIPGLVKDGTVFVVSKVKGQQGYDEI